MLNESSSSRKDVLSVRVMEPVLNEYGWFPVHLVGVNPPERSADTQKVLTYFAATTSNPSFCFQSYVPASQHAALSDSYKDCFLIGALNVKAVDLDFHMNINVQSTNILTLSRVVIGKGFTLTSFPDLNIRL